MVESYDVIVGIPLVADSVGEFPKFATFFSERAGFASRFIDNLVENTKKRRSLPGEF